MERTSDAKNTCLEKDEDLPYICVVKCIKNPPRLDNAQLDNAEV